MCRTLLAVTGLDIVHCCPVHDKTHISSVAMAIGVADGN